MVPKPKVAVAMSGGVDSSVACLILAEQGFNVFGLTMQVLDTRSYTGGSFAAGQGLSPALTTAEDAGKICRELGVPHYTVDLVEEFEAEVIAPFIENYRQGKTPNPCLICNTRFKFGQLLDKARKLGARYLATGHYVQAGRILGETGEFVENHVLAAGNLNQGCPGMANGLPREDETAFRPLLARGKDSGKDQSYALYGLNQDMLRHSMFPLGSLTKREVREISKRRGLDSTEKPESQEICFVAKGSYKTFLRERNVEARPGPIVDTSGRVLGRHTGLAHYTVGQRRGLGISGSYPLYVVSIDPDANEVVVGKREEAYANGCYVGDLNFIMAGYPDSPVRGTCMVRYRGREVAATLIPGPDNRLDGSIGTSPDASLLRPAGGSRNDTMLVRFDQPQFAVTPGQALVFYKGRFVYGGGTILQPVS